MDEMVSTLSGEGQVTVPEDIRQHLGLVEGDKVEFFIDGDGTVRVVRVVFPTIASMQGAAGRLTRPLTMHEMREIAYEERWKAKLARSE